MVRWKIEPSYNDGGIVNFFEIYGLSTDDKPVFDKEATGSTFTEVDTGDSYFYDEDSGDYIKIGGSDTTDTTETTEETQEGDNDA